MNKQTALAADMVQEARKPGDDGWQPHGDLSRWTADHVAAIAAQTGHVLPLITAQDVLPSLPGLDLWDMWPIEALDGSTAILAGRQYWFALSAPQFDDPAKRHDHARIRLISCDAAGPSRGDWRDHGNAMPDVYSPGAREWAGSARLDAQISDTVWRFTLYFTAAGRRGEAPSFEQRLFSAQADLLIDDNAASTAHWQPVELCVESDHRRYAPTNTGDGQPGMIKAFRDPAIFRDPANGQDYLLFTGSAGWDDHAHNGVIGLAIRTAKGWDLLDPIASAVGVNNELERAHVRYRGGHYYLFWVTQRHTFNGTGPTGPNGLYAMVSDSLKGPWRPVNGTGLVCSNPEAEPTQAYSWWVTGEDEVIAFTDYWGMQGRTLADHPDLVRSQFGGVPAPVVKLVFDGDRVGLA